ncbi:hypothetical protein OZD68_02185 [Wolbachia endosymbiont of Drosophila bicornuta]|uniref:hypothetical protein n=1 Tax=Wolbachia TaxID=953 RepID=UPI0015FBFFEA|nr:MULTISPECIES: hypothetical protein [Wolbachia]MBA8754920.1 hypothetical protein [Wolbachia pipientis]MDE5056403.1 hypothetical protein [Wolbachia endosymbiont of Drosophila bicornuta]
MLLLYHSHKHISYPIRTIARSAIFFGAKTIVIKVMGGIGGTGNTSLMDQCGTGDTKKNYFFLKQT